VFFLSILPISIFAQKNNTITFHHLWNNEKLELNKDYTTLHNDTITIQTLKYYISSIQFLKNNKLAWAEKKSYHLIDEDNQQTKKIILAKMPAKLDFDEMQFYIGIDSATNYAGVQSGDLDPTKGMYWTWQNGYINFKLEGSSKLCKTRNKAFQFHIGGYENGFATVQKIKSKNAKDIPIEINMDIEKLLAQINLSTINEIMMPCKAAVDIANKLPLMFSQK
jgi:hypothetical protein